MRTLFERAYFSEANKDVIDQLIQQDPVNANLSDEIYSAIPLDKVGTPIVSYGKWILNMLKKKYPTEQERRAVLPKMKLLLKSLMNNVKNLPVDKRDIFSYKSVEELEQVAGAVTPESKDKSAYDSILDENGEVMQAFRKFKEGDGEGIDYSMVFEDAHWLVFVPREFRVTSTFKPLMPKSCASLGEGAFVSHGGDVGAVIYVLAKQYENSQSTVTIEILPNRNPDILVARVWTKDNVMLKPDLPYSEAVAKMKIPANVKSALTSLPLEAPPPLPDDITAMIEKYSEYLDVPENFKKWAKQVLSSNGAVYGMKWGAITLNIDASAYIHNLEVELKAFEKGILEGMDATQLAGWNRKFGGRWAINASPEGGVDKYLTAKYDRRIDEYTVVNGHGVGEILSLLEYYLEGLSKAGYMDGVLEVMAPHIPWDAVLTHCYRGKEKGKGAETMIWGMDIENMERFIP